MCDLAAIVESELLPHRQTFAGKFVPVPYDMLPPPPASWVISELDIATILLVH